MGQICWAVVSLVTLMGAPAIGRKVAAVVNSWIPTLGLEALNLGGWISLLAGFSSILLCGLLLFEIANLWASPGKTKQGAVLLYWGRDLVEITLIAGLLVYVIGRFDVVASYLVTFAWVGIRLLQKERASSQATERYWARDWLQSNRIKADWEVRRAQWWYGVKGGEAWGAYILSGYEARFHRLIVGEPGSGKTLYLTSKILPPKLRRIAAGAPAWIVIQDYKNDFLGLIEAAETPCYRLNPVDPEAVALDLSQEVTNFAKCFEIAELLLQGTQDKGDFFANSARDLIASVMYAFVLLKRRGAISTWSLRWVILVFENPRALEKLFKRNPETAETLRVLLDKPQGGTNRFQLSPAGRDVFATVRSILFRLAPLAALWDAAPCKVSVGEMLASPCVIHLGFDTRYSLLSKRCHQLALSLLHDRIMAVGSQDAPVDFIFEEAAVLAPIPHLQDLLKAGRSEGVSVTTMLQSPIDFTAEYLKAGHPKEEPQGILELSGQLKAVFRCSDETASWAVERLFGEREYMGETYSESTTEGESTTSHGTSQTSSTSTSTSRGPASQAAITARMLKDLPKPSPTHGHSGFFEVRPSESAGGYNPHCGWHFWESGWDDLLAHAIPENKDVTYTPLPDDSDNFTLQPLSQEESDAIFGPR